MCSGLCEVYCLRVIQKPSYIDFLGLLTGAEEQWSARVHALKFCELLLQGDLECVSIFVHTFYIYENTLKNASLHVLY